MGLIHDGARVLRLFGNGSDGSLKDVALSSGQVVMLGRNIVVPLDAIAPEGVGGGTPMPGLKKQLEGDTTTCHGNGTTTSRGTRSKCSGARVKEFVPVLACRRARHHLS